MRTAKPENTLPSFSPTDDGGSTIVLTEVRQYGDEASTSGGQEPGHSRPHKRLSLILASSTILFVLSGHKKSRFGEAGPFSLTLKVFKKVAFTLRRQHEVSPATSMQSGERPP